MSEHRGLVAITGANGTIGYACVLYALRKGYHVRCITRREDAIEHLRSAPSARNFLDRITFSVVDDCSAKGAYDSAIAGVDYVIHTAGAWPKPNSHPDNDIYLPYINSTKRLIESAKNSGTVKRMIFTQAGASLVDTEAGDIYGNRMEQVLNEHVKVNEACKLYLPPLRTPHHAYGAAKAQCMTYLDDLRRQSSTPFEIVQIIPGTVIGPSELVTTPSEALARMDRLSKALLFDYDRARYAFGAIHVEDCAKAHVEALDSGKLDFQQHANRIPPWFVAAASVEEGTTGEQLWTTAADMIEASFPEAVARGTFKVGRSKVPINMPFRVDSRETAEKLLNGEQMRGLLEGVKDVARWYLELETSAGVAVDESPTIQARP